MKTILAGKIVKPQGIRGEVKINAYVDNPEGFTKLKEIIVANKSYRVLRARSYRNDVYLYLDGIIDRNTAEMLRGQDVYIDKAQSEPLKRGDYYVEDLIGLNAYVETDLIGEIENILPNRSADIFVIKGKKNYLVPFLKKGVKNIDLDKKIIVFRKKEFEEIACED